MSFKQISAAKTSRDVLINDWVEMCCRPNIPLEKSDHPAVKNFLKKHVVGGGEIPSASALRKYSTKMMTS